MLIEYAHWLIERARTAGPFGQFCLSLSAESVYGALINEYSRHTARQFREAFEEALAEAQPAFDADWPTQAPEGTTRIVEYRIRDGDWAKEP